MTTLPDWLEIVDSYDKATEWPGDEKFRMYVDRNGHLGEACQSARELQWVRVRSYREGVEAAIAELERNDIHVPSCLREMIAPPKPPLKFGEMIETHDKFGAWVDSVVVAAMDKELRGATDGSLFLEHYRIRDENKTWRRKS
jgi:hypothetical protein